ncbi:MAG: HAD family hydrolase [Nocardiaceae bacterium]|nr:HAD family hydrolase [Nocardiaceae bacterium]
MADEWLNMEKPHLVATDVDGTLLGDDERVSARNRDAVSAVVADGVPFVLATGRPPRWITPITEQLGYHPLSVCGNGAVIYDSAADRILQAWTLDVNTMHMIAGMALALFPGCGLATERVGESAHDQANPQFVTSPDYEHAWLNPDNVELTTRDVLAIPAIKMLIRFPTATSDWMYERLAPLVGDSGDVTFSTEKGLLEVSAPGVTKASGLRWAAEYLGIEPRRIVAFGDMPNDVPMLHLAGHGVAMKNAHPDALAAANEVTASNSDDGVARVLERWWTGTSPATG